MSTYELSELQREMHHDVRRKAILQAMTDAALARLLHDCVDELSAMPVTAGLIQECIRRLTAPK